MNEIHFLRPYFLLLIIPILIMIFFLFIRKRHSAGPWQNICSKDLLPYILVNKGKRYFFPYLLAPLTLILLITALSGPAWQQISQPLIKQKTGLVIAMDLSPAMDAQDIKPSRLQRAIYKINDFLEMYKEGQVALIAFSENPFVVTPLTDDIATIKNLLPALETKIMPTSGHRSDLAICKASDLLKQSAINDGTILLITSELSNQEMEDSIAAAKEKGVKISVLGVGTEETAPIPKQGGGFVKNSQGALVMATLSKTNLHRLAQLTGGTFATMTINDHDLNLLSYSLSASKSSAHHEETEKKQNKWHDQGYLLVLLALPLAALMFRRGIFIFILFCIPQFAHALSFSDLWKTKDQQAQQLYQQEQYAEAKELFQNQEWQAICNYKLGDYANAAQLFKEVHTADGFYNCGTAKAKTGDLKGALEEYDQALVLQPDHEDALYNKRVIEEFLKQNENQDQNQVQNQDQNKKNKDKKNKDKSASDQQNNDQQSESDNQNNKQDADKKSQEQKKQQKDNTEEDQQKNDQNKEKDSEKEPQEENQGNQQNSETESNPDREQNPSSDENKSSDEQNKSSIDKNDKKSMEQLNNKYREQLEKEIQKEKDQPSDKKQIQKVAQELNEEEDDPQKKIDERWLKRIQDDPSGLLRRKFQQQYQKQQKVK